MQRSALKSSEKWPTWRLIEKANMKTSWNGHHENQLRYKPAKWPTWNPSIMTNMKRIKSMRTSWISLKCCVVQTLLFWGRSNLVTLVRFMEVNIWYNHNNQLERNNKIKFKIWKLGFSRRHRLAAMGVLLEGNIFLSFET